MMTPITAAGRWLVDRADWIDGDRAFRVRINATAGPDDMLRHVLAIEREAAAAERERIAAEVRRQADDLESDWDTTYSAEKGISPYRLLAWLEEHR